MDSEACQALREIEIGRLKISDFAPPEVFSSGLFNQYPLTVADLRWHLTECDECGSSMTVARHQLADFDLMRLAALGAALDCLQTALGAQLDWLKGESDFLGELVVDESEREKGEPTGRADLVGFWSDQVFEENRDRFFLAAIRIHAFLGGRIARWLETLLPPATPRAHVVRDHEIVDVRIASDRVDAAEAPDLSSLLAEDEKAAAFVLRSLLVREAVGNLAAEPGDELIEKECAAPKLLEPQTEGIQRLRWRTVWEHYTELAEMKAERVCRIGGMAGPTDSRIAEQLKPLLEAVVKKVEAIDERTESLLYGQNAIMDSLERLEAAAARLLREYEDAPAAVKEACLSRVKRALPLLFERLADDTRRFLEAAEWVYSEAPSGLDRSLVIVGFTKAFDTELWHALEPLQSELQRLADTRPYKKKPVTEFSLGELARLLVDNRSVLRPPLDKLGLAYSAILEAIRTVNREVRAKHREARGEAEARSFRTLFLDTPSVLAALCPPKKTE